ncbi:MAG: Gfo/Idh/MocA family oxidoreductase [Bryobacteraceae bacterium]|nr:Gfo/Idh/MocA family oxidoreductase [Bryobacteraceae bacterium]
MTRRTLVAAPAVLLAQAPSDEMRVAIIGVGNRGTALLAAALKAKGARIVAVADLDEARRNAAAARITEAGQPAPKLYTDFRQMLDAHKDVDAVIIATPVDTHKAIAVATLEVGKHVYLEKPVALDPAECAAVAAAAKSAKGILQLGFQLRHDPARAASMAHLHSGALGKVIYLHAHRHTGDLPHHIEWYFDKKRSGDIIVEQACHIIDLMVWAAGGPPETAYGSGGINLLRDEPRGRSILDNYSVLYEWADGKRLNFSQMYFDPPGFSGIKERVYAERGAVDLATGMVHYLDKRPAQKLDFAPGDSTELSIEAFLGNARGKKRPLNDIVSARQSTLVAMLGRKSIYEKRVVRWSEL